MRSAAKNAPLLACLLLCPAACELMMEKTTAALGDLDDTNSPIVAVWAHPSNSSVPECGGDCEFVKAAYVKWLESSGVRSLPIRFDSSPEETKLIMDSVNGLLLPGGTPPVPDSARWALNYATELNARGDFFPVWGTCVGWEWMAQALAGDYRAVTTGFDAENFTQPLGILTGAANSRMFSGFPAGLLDKASSEPLTANAHTKGVTPEDFLESGLDQVFRLLAVNEDRQGRAYVSAVEAFDIPMYGLQWHPEKSPFDWGLDPDGTPHHVINHSADAVQLAQVLSNFFASETRRNHHAFRVLKDWEDKMFHTREVTPTGPSTGQRYIFHWERDEQRGTTVASLRKSPQQLRGHTRSD